MKTKRAFCYLLLFLTLLNTTLAQELNENARAAYLKAEEYFYKNENVHALEQLASAEKYAGETSPKIEYLRINILKSQFDKSNGNYPELKHALSSFFSITDKDQYSQDNYQEMVKLQSDVNHFFKTDSISSQKLLLDGDLSDIDKYLLIHPNTFYLEPLDTRRQNLQNSEVRIIKKVKTEYRLTELEKEIPKAKRKSFRKRFWGGLLFLGGGAIGYTAFAEGSPVTLTGDTQIDPIIGGVGLGTSLLGAVSLIRGNHRKVKMLKNEQEELLKKKGAVVFSIFPYHSEQFALDTYGFKLKMKF